MCIHGSKINSSRMTVEVANGVSCCTASFHANHIGFGGFDASQPLTQMGWMSSKQQEFFRTSAPQS
eukprot:14030605-Heterocapsa_arctica.AAC.1